MSPTPGEKIGLEEPFVGDSGGSQIPQGSQVWSGRRPLPPFGQMGPKDAYVGPSGSVASLRRAQASCIGGTGIKAKHVGGFRVLNDLNQFSNRDLLSLYAGVLRELRQRGVIGSSNNPVADYAERLTAAALGLKLMPKSTTGFDAMDASGERYEVKARRLRTH